MRDAEGRLVRKGFSSLQWKPNPHTSKLNPKAKSLTHSTGKRVQATADKLVNGNGKKTGQSANRGWKGHIH